MESFAPFYSCQSNISSRIHGIATGPSSAAAITTSFCSISKQRRRFTTPRAQAIQRRNHCFQTYTRTQLLRILRTSVGTGPRADASLILADQLIAAKLNVANGADEPDPVPVTINDADSLLSGFSGMLPYHVKPSTMTAQQMVNDAATLESFNKGLLTPGCSQ